MSSTPVKPPFRVSRRAALLAGAAIVAGGATLAGMRRKAANVSFLNGVDLSAAKPVGDGFYEVGGWIVTESDLESAGARPDRRKSDDPA